MARLLVKTAGLNLRTLELRLGANRLGRDPDADFTLNHPSVSFNHCEVIVASDGLYIRDCDSTNGTFLNGENVKVARLEAGQTLVVGDVELLVESTEVVIAIPEIKRDRPAPPPLRPDGSVLCRNHPNTPSSFRCTNCHELMCAACVHVMRIQGGGKPLYLCPLCSHKCEPLVTGTPAKRKDWMAFLERTVSLPKLYWKNRTKSKD
jgi:FHA domain/B-box zinc finger